MIKLLSCPTCRWAGPVEQTVPAEVDAQNEGQPVIILRCPMCYDRGRFVELVSFDKKTSTISYEGREALLPPLTKLALVALWAICVAEVVFELKYSYIPTGATALAWTWFVCHVKRWQKEVWSIYVFLIALSVTVVAWIAYFVWYFSGFPHAA